MLYLTNELCLCSGKFKPVYVTRWSERRKYVLSPQPFERPWTLQSLCNLPITFSPTNDFQLLTVALLHMCMQIHAMLKYRALIPAAIKVIKKIYEHLVPHNFR